MLSRKLAMKGTAANKTLTYRKIDDIKMSKVLVA